MSRILNVIIIMKQTFDTEEKIVLRDGQVAEDGVKFIINPYDEYAVEEALRLKEKHGAHVLAITVGPERSAEALRTALAMGVDEAVLLADERIPQDEHSVSAVLSAIIASRPCDLILGGSFSVDNGAGQVAGRLAQRLSLPHVTSITQLDLHVESTNAAGDGCADYAVVKRDAEGDVELLKVQLPALFTAQQGLNEPRYPSLPGIMKAKKKPLNRLTLDDLNIAPDDLAPRTSRLSLSLPPSRTAGQILQGDLAAQTAQLFQLIHSRQGGG